MQRKSKRLRATSELSDARGCTPSCQPGFPADLPVHGPGVRGPPSFSLCVLRRHLFCFFCFAADKGAQKEWWGSRGLSLWTALACGMWDGVMRLGNFLRSLLFTLSGWVFMVSLCLIRFCVALRSPDMFLLGATLLSGAFEVVALRTVLGIGLGMNMKVVKDAAAFEGERL